MARRAPTESSLAESLLADLNPRQREAVKECDGPVLVIAGPGTGKTRVITEKVHYLVRVKGVQPERILSLTFTEKAAGEMSDRIRRRLAEAGVRGLPPIHTFHGYCFTLVQEFAHRLGFKGPLRLLFGPLYVQFVVEQIPHLATANTDLVGRTNTFARTLADFASHCHDEGLLVASDAAIERRVAEWVTGLDARDRSAGLEVQDLAASLPVLLRRQYAENVVTYGDLLTLAVRLLRENADVLEDVRGRFDYVLVDELQDNNLAQFHLVNLLAEKHQRVLVVGDEDQCIYRFRGAAEALLGKFKEHWKKSGKQLATVNLEENYRSTAAIIATCQTLIANNSGREKGKTLRVADDRQPIGAAQVHLRLFATDADERHAVVRLVLEALEQSKRRPADLAILCRSLGNVTDLVRALRAAGVGVEVVGEGGVFGNPLVREVIAWLRALARPDEDHPALYKILRFPSMGLTHADLRALGRASSAAQAPVIVLLEALRADPKAAIRGVSPQGLERLRAFTELYHRFRVQAHALTRGDLLGLVEELLCFTGLRGRLVAATHQGKLDAAALAGFCQLVSTYEEQFPSPSLDGFVRYLDLLEEIGHEETLGTASDDPTTVKVMTIHQSKGREFPVVFVTGLGDRFPVQQRRPTWRKFLDAWLHPDLDVNQAHLEEERRVLYVALSRAQEELHLSSYEERNGKRVKKPGTFLEEVRGAGSVREEQVPRSEKPLVVAAGAALRTRGAIELRLHHLISEFGLSLQGDQLQPTLEEALRLLASLLAHGAPRGEQAAREALAALGLPAHWEIRRIEPDAYPGVDGPLRLSSSNLETYEACPRKYYFRHVLEIPERVGTATRLGTAIHAVLEAFHQRHRQAKPQHWPELEELFEEQVQAVTFVNDQEREQGIARGRQILHKYLEEEAERSGEIEGMDLEKKFSLDFAPDVTLVGSIDRVDHLADGRIRVVDYKTGKLWSRPEFLRGYQMPLYAWAAQEVTGKPLACVEVIGLKQFNVTQRGEQIERQVLPWNDGSSHALTPQRLDELRAAIAAIVASIRTGGFEPTPSEQTCGYCPYQLLCEQAHGVVG